MRTLIIPAACLASLAFSLTPARGVEVEALLNYLPESANAVAVVRVSDILQSPLARQQQWKQRPSEFLAGAGTVPNWTDALVTGASVHLGSETDNWSITILPLPDDVTMESVAQHEQAPLQELSGVPAVLSKRNAYFVEIAPSILGIHTPAMRQDVGRWVREALRSEQAELSDYLTQAATQSDHIVLALDMRDMLDPDLVKRRLEATPSLRGQKKDLVKGLADVIAQLRGVKFTANFDNRTVASITVSFSRELPADATWLSTVFLEVLNDQRMALRDFEQAEVSLSGAQMVMTTELSDACLRQIMLLVSAPFPDESAPPVKAPSQPRRPIETEEQATIRKNRRYYQAVNRALNDMQRHESWSLNYSQAGGWILRAAKKIENLSISGIDPDLASYAADVSSKLRAIAATLHGMIVEVDAQDARTGFNWRMTPGFDTGGGVYGGRVYGGGGYGPRGGWAGGGWAAPYWSVDSNLSEVRRNQAQAVTNGERERAQILQSITDQRAEIRQLMQSRYGVDFDRPF